MLLTTVLAGIATTPAHAESIRSQQWHLDAMGADEIWKISTGKGVTVAVIDTGVDATNGDLRGRVLEGKDLTPDEPGDERTDNDGHGTGMAGIIAGTGSSGGGDGAFGLAPGAKILPVRVPGEKQLASQAEAEEQFNVLAPEAIRYATDAGAKVINVSMGVDRGSPQLAAAVRYANEKGSLIFAATGNDGLNQDEYPASTPGVVAVGSLGKDLKKSDFSQFGPQVDVSAPGENIIHACGGKTGLCNGKGTSHATAIASATAALIWSQHPEWTNNQVLRVMLNTISGPTSGNKRNDHIGYGAVRPLRALTTPGDPGPADEYPLPDFTYAAAKSPSPEPSSPAKASAQPTAPSTASDDDSNSPTVWIAAGIGTAAVLGAAVVIPGLRNRRRTRTTPAPAVTTPPYPHESGQPYYAQQPLPPHGAHHNQNRKDGGT
ncbi:type VII secretion-associated serine protease mycosin [Streptomyces peucetius]|uniref:Type VII secretion-associated serine protease mycosin n=1 Tax=Streptomyces peucetius TaxID=1950 RepID=A0ABY6I5W2_STRPE|nr:type VII secretion-associated serine protease mycosin [Streptomyces peucetius]UYQ62375.1 type VII secretion-associated serine protease mycosin [Streptomyces peucetius]